jgi:hypothetical protein
MNTVVIGIINHSYSSYVHQLSILFGGPTKIVDVNDKSLSYVIPKDVMFPQLSTIQIEPYMTKKKPTMVSASSPSHGVFGGNMPWHVDPPERHEASSGAAAVNPNPKKT